MTTTMWTPRADVWIMFQQYQRARWYEGPDLGGDDLGLRSGGIVDSPLGPWEFLFVEPPYHSSPAMLEIIEQKNGFQGIFRYRTTALSRKKAEFFARDYQERLRAALEDPGAGF